jgi:hypothetical protein
MFDFNAENCCNQLYIPKFTSVFNPTIFNFVSNIKTWRLQVKVKNTTNPIPKNILLFSFYLEHIVSETVFCLHLLW